MATLITNRFTSYFLTPSEEAAGQTLNVYNIQFLQNLLATFAEERLSLTYDGDKPLLFIQQEAELQGKMGIISYLLDCAASQVQTQT